ncbi:MAG: SET domain-containing protein [Bacteroidetes bacterium]|nr:SET domain-containing protein [Bacteroidota bacterium]
MIHPKTSLQYVNDTVGYGVFAAEDIPEGTIVYVKDSLEMVVSPTDYLIHSAEMRDMIDKYSYLDPEGNRIVSWDFAKYVNHCCNCNTISTGYGFEMAIRDIKKGEQITDEYGIFNLDKEMSLVCGESSCRKQIRPSDFDNYYREWDQRIQKSIGKLFEVEQPLLPFLDPNTRTELDAFFEKPESYKSVYALKLKDYSKNGMNLLVE